MTFIAVPNAAKVVVRFATVGVPWTNTFWFTKALFDDTDLTDLASQVDQTYGNGSLAFLNAASGYAGVTAYDMRSLIGSVITDNTNAGSGSANTGEPLTLGQCLVLTLRTAARGRSGRGRVFFSGLGEGNWNGTDFAGGAPAALVALFGAMKYGVSLHGWTPVVCSHQLDGVPRTPPVTEEIILAEVRSTRSGSQRRRNQRP